MMTTVKMIHLVAFMLGIEKFDSSSYLTCNQKPLPNLNIPVDTDAINDFFNNATGSTLSNNITHLPQQDYLVASDNSVFSFKLSNQTGVVYQFWFSELYKIVARFSGESVFLRVNVSNKEAGIFLMYDKSQPIQLNGGQNSNVVRLDKEQLFKCDPSIYVHLIATNGALEGNVSFETVNEIEPVPISVCVAVFILICLVMALVRFCSHRILRDGHPYDNMLEYDVSSITINPRKSTV